MKPLKRALWLCLLAGAAASAGGIQLHGRIVGKAGDERNRRWQLRIGSDSAGTVSGVEITAVRFRQTSAGGGAACTPAVTAPTSFPLALGKIPAGGTVDATLIIDFGGCDNRAQFTVEVEFSGDGGAAGIIQRRNDYR